MRRLIVIGTVCLAAAVGSTAYAQGGGGGGGGGSACPPASPAGGGDPSCGKPKPAKPPECTLGPITSAVDAIDFGPLDATVHDVLCALAENGITV